MKFKHSTIKLKKILLISDVIFEIKKLLIRINN